MRFWVRRYGPPEIVGTLTMVLAANITAGITPSTLVIALSALWAGAIGFYAVMGVTVYREQWVIWGRDVRPRPSTVVRRTTLCLLAEFGATEFVDLLLLRPVLLLGGLLFIDNTTGGLLAGKLAADVIFSLIAGVAFTVTSRRGMREVPAR